MSAWLDSQGWAWEEVQCGSQAELLGAPGPFTSGLWLRARVCTGASGGVSSSDVMKVRPRKVKGLALSPRETQPVLKAWLFHSK